MSIVSYSDSVKSKKNDEIIRVEDGPKTKKVLEEDEYLNRMSKIIRRDFFSDIEFPENCDEPSSSYMMTERSNQSFEVTPGTHRTQFSTPSSLKSRRESNKIGLNEFLDRYTSEDNAYFEKLQRKELKRHRLKYPWLYRDRASHNKRIQEQLKLPSLKEQASQSCDSSSTKMIDWPYNPKSSLFYPPSDEEKPRLQQSTINYHSNQMVKPLFKMPLQPRSIKAKGFNRQSDKIGIDGKFINGSETPIIGGYSLLPPPETPRPTTIEVPRLKSESERFYIPSDSPRDELAHRVYQEKVANSIRTPRTTINTPINKTPKSFRKGYAEFSFSPERVKNSTPSLRRK